MFLLILLWTLVFLLWIWLKRDTNKDEPPTFFALDLRKLYRITEDTEGFWSLIKEMSRECQKLDGVMKLSFGPRTVYVLTDPEDCFTVSNACLQKDSVYDFAKNWIGNGLITSSVPVWKMHRKLLNPIFNARILNNFLGVFNSLSRTLIKNLEVEVGKGPFDPHAYSRRYALELICMASFGTKLMENLESKNKYMNKIDEIMNIYISRIQVFLFHSNFMYSFSSLKKREDECIETMSNITNTVKYKKDEIMNIYISRIQVFLFHSNFMYSFSSLKKREDECIETMSNITNTVLSEMKTSYKEKKCFNTEEKKTKGFEFETLAEIILKICENNSSQFTDQDIRQHIDTFIAAGEDTSAGFIMLCLVTVGSYPRVQEEIHKELNQVFGDEDRDVTKEDLNKLVYLDAVIKETMRFYPMVPAIARYVDKNVKLRNCTLSKGRTVILSIYGIHRHPMWGPDADEFRPERWLSQQTNYYKYFASFGFGRRVCIGKAMAIASLKVTFAHIFQNYRIHGDHKNMKLKYEITLKAVSGQYITIERKNRKQ
ncbi:cytochrome P450 4C1-like [Danaus plexippus]|uniref:cytochrome P450 4C1-like n=1 Tax=Danaus plexippus TaxID=13037 RepID=UPI002AB2A39D|nr:cytochrome P450 4C1-like [Danaus plexippus]